MKTIAYEGLDARFRQAMDIPVETEHEEALRQALHGLMGELLARRDLMANPRLQSMLLACRLRLRELQNLCIYARAADAPPLQKVEMREYTEDLCGAADWLLRRQGRRVRFDAPEEAACAALCPRAYGWLVLELICNAARHCHGEEILVSMAMKMKRARRVGAIVLTVECRGHLDLERLHAAGQRMGSGVAAVTRTAWLQRGTALWLERDGKAVAAVRVPTEARREREWHDVPDQAELLEDLYSPVYVALSPVVGTIL